MSSGRRLHSDTEAGRIYLAGLLAWGFIQMPSSGQDVLQIQGAIPACWGCRCKSGSREQSSAACWPCSACLGKDSGLYLHRACTRQYLGLFLLIESNKLSIFTFQFLAEAEEVEKGPQCITSGQTPTDDATENISHCIRDVDILLSGYGVKGSIFNDP